MARVCGDCGTAKKSDHGERCRRCAARRRIQLQGNPGTTEGRRRGVQRAIESGRHPFYDPAIQRRIKEKGTQAKAARRRNELYGNPTIFADRPEIQRLGAEALRSGCPIRHHVNLNRGDNREDNFFVLPNQSAHVSWHNFLRSNPNIEESFKSGELGKDEMPVLLYAEGIC